MVEEGYCTHLSRTAAPLGSLTLRGWLGGVEVEELLVGQEVVVGTVQQAIERGEVEELSLKVLLLGLNSWHAVGEVGHGDG